MMKKYQLSTWIALFMLATLAMSCSRKNYPANDLTDTETQYENSKKSAENYTPPPVIAITDDKAKTNKDGELYFDDDHGYRYWRNCDGKYYLDSKYERGVVPKKKYSKKSNKKQPKESPEEDYAGQ
jgi:hypothetical protein